MTTNKDSDSTIYAALRNCFDEKHRSKKGKEFSQGRANNRTRQILKIIPPQLRIYSMLDVGCSEGSITADLGYELGLEPKKIHGCDISEPKATVGFQFTHLKKDSELPYKSQSQSLITALMSLHHMKDCPAMLREIHRVLDDDGYFIIREHNVETNDLRIVLDIVHGMYAMVISDEKEMENFTVHFAEYRRRTEWSNLITQTVPFEEICVTDFRSGSTSHLPVGADIVNPLHYYYAVYRKSRKNQKDTVHKEPDGDKESNEKKRKR
jgi:ubiquinone/menaquinone biosynthesis C-methylase UbiE